MLKLVVLISGTGSNLRALLEALRDGVHPSAGSGASAGAGSNAPDPKSSSASSCAERTVSAMPLPKLGSLVAAASPIRATPRAYG